MGDTAHLSNSDFCIRPSIGLNIVLSQIGALLHAAHINLRNKES